MVDFFTALYDQVLMLVKLVISLVEGIITGVTYMMSSASTLVFIVSYLPIFMSGCAIAVITLSVVKFIIGR